MNVKRFSLALAATLSAAFTVNVNAAEFALTLTDDAWTNGNQTNTNFGTSTVLSVHDFGPKFALARFSAAPVAGRNVTQATLRIFLRSLGSPGAISIYPVTSAWSENTVTWATQPPSEVSPVATVTLTTANVNTFVSVDVTSLVQRWAAGGLPDAGVLITTVAPIKASIDAKERIGGMRMVLNVVTSENTGAVSIPSSQAEVLSLAGGPITISEAGAYVLDRDWRIPIEATTPSGYIQIQADDVTIDMGGHTINSETIVPIAISGNRATVKNGRIFSAEATAVESNGAATVIDSVWFSSQFNAVTLAGADSTIKNSILGGGAYVQGARATLSANVMGCYRSCLLVLGGHSKISGNSISSGPPYAVSVRGAGNVLTGNSIDLNEGGVGIQISGDRNIISDTTLKAINGGTAISVNGAGNAVRGNVAHFSGNSASGESRWNGGIAFLQSGNFYGNNQCNADQPFQLNGTSQTDWGNNFGF